MPLYEEKLINPLAVRFSQDRIWPDFQDGTHIEDSLAEISTVPLKGASYDLVLRPPFPPMEIIRLQQELREADGEIAKNDKGQRLYGEDSWFTFDNRRLYCLQRAALQFWPMVVAVVVKVLFDFPAVRCARHKFRTTSDGCSVKISLPDGQQGSLWTWQDAAKTVQTTQEGSRAIEEAVRRDTRKTGKEMLDQPPPQAVLYPGTRDATTAERFNSSQGNGQNNTGKAAGMQLLSLLQTGDDGGSGLKELFAGGGSASAAPAKRQPQRQPQQRQQQRQPAWGAAPRGKAEAHRAEDDGWHDADAQGYAAERGQGGGQGRNRRRRKPKGGGKGEGTANDA